MRATAPALRLTRASEFAVLYSTNCGAWTGPRARKVQETMQRLEQARSAVPTEEEMAQALNLSMVEYQRLLDEIRPAVFVCLDATVDGDNEEGVEKCESIADTTQEDPVDGASRRELTRLIFERLQQLPEIQRKVLALYYFEDLRLREIAEAFGLTESRICQIHAQAILAIKTDLNKYESCTT
jgi:RNA polymerase sigma factor for flagellar operon FliA